MSMGLIDEGKIELEDDKVHASEAFGSSNQAAAGKSAVGWVSIEICGNTVRLYLVLHVLYVPYGFVPCTLLSSRGTPPLCSRITEHNAASAQAA